MSPSFILYDTPDEYKAHYEEHYCKKPIITFDDIPVFFPKDKFSHAFYESSDRRGSKDLFSLERSKRIEWIRLTLESREALLFQGWDSKKKCYHPDSRVSVVYDNFVVVIRLSLKRNGKLKANFITCYQADNSIGKIKNSPIWDKEECMKELQK